MKMTKKIISLLLALLLVLGVCAAAPFTASAEFYTADGIKWCYEVLEDGTSVRIVYGSEPADPDAGSISGHVTIPDKIYTVDKVYTVTEIYGAFNSTVLYGGITSVTIPDTVRTIGKLSFNKLSNLSSVSFGEGSALTTIGASAFYGCKNLSSITIPQGVKTIDDYAFYNCESLSSVVIPDNVTTFGNYVFRNCSNLQSAVIGANVPSLYGTFISCGNLESVTFSSNSVTDFSGLAFYGCGSLTSITIPCDFDKNSFSPSSSSYINIPETDLDDNPDNDTHTFTVQGTSASGTFSYTHNYGEPVWNWDNPEAPVCEITCSKCENSLSATAENTTATHTEPQGAVPGFSEYKASVVLNGETIEGTHIFGALEIANYAQLKTFADRVNSGETGLCAILTEDIVCKNSADDTGYATDWTPIGDSDNQYTGIFDGQSHTITGLTFNDTSATYAGLFGYIQGVKDGDEVIGGIIKNVGLEGINITAIATAAETVTRVYAYVGGIAGYNNGGMVTNCYNTGTVTAMATSAVTAEGETIRFYGHTGGIAGYNNGGAVTNCYNTGAVTGGFYVGGVVGYNNNGTVTNCYNTGSATSTSDDSWVSAAGIVGYNNYYSTVSDCYNTGSITGSFSAGGVVGYNYGTITNCYNSGTIEGHAGIHGTGAGGVASDNNEGTISNCYNTGNVTATVEEREDKTEFEAYAGGVVAESGISATITNCYNTGNVTATVAAVDSSARIYAGGVEGNCFYGSSSINCYNTGNVTATATATDYSANVHAGGIAGRNQFSFANCHNTGNVSATATLTVTEAATETDYIPEANVYIGGALGLNTLGASVNNCYSTGDLTAKSTVTATGTGMETDFVPKANVYAGGAAGYNDSGCTVRNCYSTGSVTAEAEATGDNAESDVRIGGAVGYNDSSSTVTNCYYDNSVCGDIGAVDGEDTETAKGLTTEEMTGENALDNMVFVYEDGEENPWLTKANDTYGLYYPHLKGFDFKTEDGERVEWPAEAGTQMTADEIETVYWPPKIEKYNVAVTVAPTGGGTVSGDGIYENGNKATLTATPSQHYHFVNWTENGEEVSTDAEYTFTVDKYRNLVANFELDTFTITFENDDGTPLQSGSVAYGETPVYSGENPTKGSTDEYTYTFAGWSPEIAEVTGDATYTATYDKTPVDYKLTWVVDSENYKNETIPFGSNVSAPEVDERAGYTFEWVDEIPETMPAEDITINGTFTIIKYTATFVKEDGTELETREYDIETTSIDEPAVPEKAGYTGKWEDYTLAIGGITVKPVYTNISGITLNTEDISDTTGYKEDQTFTADAKDLPEGAEVHWFVNGEDVGTGSSYTVEDPTEDYTVQAKVLDKDGNVIAESETAKVHVKNGFFDRLKAFFAELIEKILGKAIADLLSSVC